MSAQEGLNLIGFLFMGGFSALVVALAFVGRGLHTRATMRRIAAAIPGFSVVEKGRVPTMEGDRDGRRLRVSLGRDPDAEPGSGWQGLIYSVEVPGAPSLVLAGAADARAWARAGAHGQEALAAIDYLFGIGIHRVVVRDGWVRVSRESSNYALAPERVEQVLQALERLAPLFERRALTIRVGGVERASVAWVEGERVLCPYCRDGLGQDDLVACEACGTVHHAECMAEGGGCSIFGCAGRGRREDERVRSPSA